MSVFLSLFLTLSVFLFINLSLFSYYDELLAPRAEQGVPTAPYNPFYAPEVFTYNQVTFILEGAIFS